MYDINERKLNQVYSSLSLYIQRLIFLIIILVNLINSENLIIINNYASEVHLKIKGIGNQNILNSNFEYYPSEVLVNGYINHTCNKTCFLSEEINNITLIFSDEIKTCANMFKDLDNILEIDLSNFDVTHVKSMKNMFRNCLNLTNITLSNFYTHDLVEMSHV